MYESYNEISKSQNQIKTSKEIIKNLNISDIPLAPKVGVNIKKKDDVISLFSYLSSDNRQYYEKYFNECVYHNNEENVIESDSECEY